MCQVGLKTQPCFLIQTEYIIYTLDKKPPDTALELEQHTRLLWYVHLTGPTFSHPCECVQHNSAEEPAQNPLYVFYSALGTL